MVVGGDGVSVVVVWVVVVQMVVLKKQGSTPKTLEAQEAQDSDCQTLVWAAFLDTWISVGARVPEGAPWRRALRNEWPCASNAVSWSAHTHSLVLCPQPAAV